MDTVETLNAAIDRSMSHNEIVQVAVSDFDDAILTLADADGEIDHVRIRADGDDAAYVEVWGWSDTTPENEQDWRLRLVLA